MTNLFILFPLDIWDVDSYGIITPFYYSSFLYRKTCSGKNERITRVVEIESILYFPLES